MSKNKKVKTNKDRIRELSVVLDIMDYMLAALVDVFERKGLLTSDEWRKTKSNKK